MSKVFKRLLVVAAIAATGACSLYLLCKMNEDYLDELDTLKDILSEDDIPVTA